MRKNGCAAQLLQRLVKMIYSKSFLNASRVEAKFFTRERKMRFSEYILFILRSSKRSLQVGLDFFFDEIDNEPRLYSRQAFSKGRQRILYQAFEMLFRSTVSEFYQNKGYQTWNGYRLLAVDGSDLNLPNTPELLQEFGSQPFTQGSQVQGLASCLVDVLNGVIVDALLAPFHANERALAQQHLDSDFQLEGTKDILLADRGYPCTALIEQCEKMGTFYLFRCNKDNFFAEIRDVKGTDEIVQRKMKNGKHLKLRVVQIPIGDKIETLITNLGAEYHTEDLKELYHLRWGIETCYDSLKNQMQLENFSGCSKNVILQDFYATMTVFNLVSAMMNDVRAEVSEKRHEEHDGKQLKYEYKLNRATAISHAKNILVSALLTDNPRQQTKLLKRMYKYLAHSVVAIVPDRSYPRQHAHPALRYPNNTNFNP